MYEETRMNTIKTLRWLDRLLACTALLLGASVMQGANAATLTISTHDQTGAGVPGFRYLVEEDTMYKPTPGQVDDFSSLSFNFHKSHTPVAQDANGAGLSGETDAASVDIELPQGDYFVSVLPYNGHAIGGGGVRVGADGATVNARVNAFPIPTAQISIQVFEDNSPLNGAIDPGERGLNGSMVDGEFIPFHVILEDPAGQYGAGGGRVAYDAYGNPLGTDYNADGSVASYPAGAGTNGTIITPGTLPAATVPLVPNDEGYLVIKHLPPGKYGVMVVPPTGAGWKQTSTIEGSKVIDAWVKANEPENFVEFGPPGPHVFVGFVREYDCNAGVWGDGSPIQLTRQVEIDGVVTTVAEDDPDLNPCTGYPAVCVVENNDIQDDQPGCSGTNATPTGMTASITGSVVNNHMSRSPEFQFHSGDPLPGCRVGVNLGIAGKTIYSGACDAASAFAIDGLTPGDYSLSIYDDNLTAVIANHPFSIAANAAGDGLTVTALTQLVASNTNGSAPNTADCAQFTCALGEIPVFNWFHRLYTSVFYDRDEDGVRDCVTAACDDPNVDDVSMNADAFAANLRWRDGRVYQNAAIDTEGMAPFDTVFPFFHWLVAETDFAKFKATGATITVDNGGGNLSTANAANDLQANGYIAQAQTDAGGAALPDCDANPNAEQCTTDGYSLTLRGPALTLGMQGFLGQKSVIEFGKTNYAENENGGISGMAIYAITRAEHDPRYAAAEIWEPGIPRVQFALYMDDNIDEIADDRDGSGDFTPADVDNYPLGWFDGGSKGPEDIDHNDNGVFDYGDAVDVTWSDSWDDNLPSNCQGANLMAGVADNHCMDGMRNWNQVRPAVFDGGYAFPSNPTVDSPAMLGDYLAKGYYIVQSFTPPGYELVKEEDKNVDFGDEYAVPQLLPPICVGDDHVVPPLMTFVTDASGVQKVAGDPADFAAPHAGETRPLCDKKHILLTDGKNAAADFHYFTEVPKAAHVVGGILNDLANEFNPNAPTFGEKFAPPWLPVAFYDWTGKEITRVYADQYGKYNAMLPSTFSANAASPSGFTPNMVTACMNDGGYVTDPNDPNRRIIDPNYNPQYTQFCYTFQYMPGATTYLDTPVLQIAAFAGAGYQLDCEASDVTPMIASVTGPNGLVGPYIADQTVADEASRTLTINSVGRRDVLNPSSNEFTQKFISRDYGFGSSEGHIWLTNENGQAWSVNPVDGSWMDASVQAIVPRNIPDGRYQLSIVHANGNESPMGVSVTVGPLEYRNNVVRQVVPSNAAGATPIQDAIDAANRGDLILVAAGVYDELPILWKPVYLQGAGAFSTTINARPVPAEKLQNWKSKIDTLVANGQFDLLPGQENGALLFDTEEGPGIMVVGKAPGNLNTFNNGSKRSAIDGFSITGAATGGGIFINGYVNGLDISNNRITGNEGTYGGGIRIGHLALLDNNGEYPDARNWNLDIHHNQVIRNGTQNGAGGGIAIYKGSSNYAISDNLICGNFAATDGAGIGHLGLSTGGLIEDNQIIFNQSFRQTPGFETDGGGVLIAGMDPAPAEGLALTEGSGHVTINRNLIQGNQAGAGDGAGIAIRRANGADVAADPSNNKAGTPWWTVRIYNNTIANNVAGLAGGAISLKDAINVLIENNTIANNNSTATAGAAFAPGSPSQSTPQVAGIASYHWQTLQGVIGGTGANSAPAPSGARFNKAYPNPLLQSNILWQNKSFYFVLSASGDVTSNCDANVDPNCLPSQLIPLTDYTDLGVVNAAAGESLDQLRFSTVSDATNYPAGWNLQSGDPAFVNAYLNQAAGLSPVQAEFQTIMVAPALDEGGNWIDARYAPLSINDVDLQTPGDQAADYHLGADSIAIDAGNPGRNRPAGGLDIDQEPGQSNLVIDQGSDEVQ
jgi:hypothetical protein